MQYKHIKIFHLKLNIRNLVYESRQLRIEMERSRSKDLRDSLYNHRQYTVSKALRIANLAYACMRQVPYERVEPRCREQPDWKEVEKKLSRFGSRLGVDRIFYKYWIKNGKEYYKTSRR